MQYVCVCAILCDGSMVVCGKEKRKPINRIDISCQKSQAEIGCVQTASNIAYHAFSPSSTPHRITITPTFTGTFFTYFSQTLNVILSRKKQLERVRAHSLVELQIVEQQECMHIISIIIVVIMIIKP